MTETSVTQQRRTWRTHLFIIGGVLILMSVLSMVFLNPSVPEAECAPAGATSTSGFVDEEKGCPITIESYNEIREAESSPRWGNIAGAILILAGLVTAGLGLRRRPPKPPAAPPAA